MRDTTHYRDMLNQNSSATVGFGLAATAVYAAKYGSCDGDERTSAEVHAIARRLKSTYGETLTAAEVHAEMDSAEKGN